MGFNRSHVNMKNRAYFSSQMPWEPDNGPDSRQTFSQPKNRLRFWCSLWHNRGLFFTFCLKVEDKLKGAIPGKSTTGQGHRKLKWTWNSSRPLHGQMLVTHVSVCCYFNRISVQLHYPDPAQSVHRTNSPVMKKSEKQWWWKWSKRPNRSCKSLFNLVSTRFWNITSVFRWVAERLTAVAVWAPEACGLLAQLTAQPN